MIVSFSATGLAILLGVPAGYGIAKMRATKAAVVILIARITPGLSYLIPLFLLFQWIGLTGTVVPRSLTRPISSRRCGSGRKAISSSRMWRRSHPPCMR